ncbi:hypothetical protein [Plantactinospora sp. B24E8]|uniref:hypothetical protein n=1 Tax=Plantactinospora sp. B24E8 TaxID=3153567 RepID=UPI00325D6F9F
MVSPAGDGAPARADGRDPGLVGVPLRVSVDNARGGRWTSLAGGGREWLWRGAATGRDRVVPGDAFVDAGGLEECLPTVRGVPDHGDVWSRPWRQVTPEIATVECADFTLTRRIRGLGGTVVADYRLTAEPGYRFVWAGHALLEVSPTARLVAPDGTPTRLYPEAADLLPAGDWPAGARWMTAPWPAPAGLPLDRLGPDDGTALGAILVGCPDVRVVDGPDVLRWRLDCADQPRSVALWRNLRGWPQPTPYRSVGVEPMLGAVFDLAEVGSAPDSGPAAAPAAGNVAGDGDPAPGGGTVAGGDAVPGGDVALVPANGEVRWRLTVSAYRSGRTP